MDQIALYEKKLDRELSKHSVFLQMEQATGVPKTKLVALGLASILALLMFHYLSEMFTALVLFAYPAAMTVAAIESNNKSEDVHWMVYWMVVALLDTIEILSIGLLPSIIPFYSLVKLAFCIWMFLPQTKGASLMYKTVLRPLVGMYQNSPLYQSAVSKTKAGVETVSKGVASAKSSIENIAKEKIAEEIVRSKDD